MKKCQAIWLGVVVMEFGVPQKASARGSSATDRRTGQGVGAKKADGIAVIHR